MSNWSESVARVNAAGLNTFGEAIIYLPNKGAGAPISTAAILQPPTIDQSGAPGYFADIKVDPVVVTAPMRGDQVIWADDTAYVVAKVTRPVPAGMFILALHRKLDPL